MVVLIFGDALNMTLDLLISKEINNRQTFTAYNIQYSVYTMELIHENIYLVDYCYAII